MNITIDEMKQLLEWKFELLHNFYLLVFGMDYFEYWNYEVQGFE